MLKTFKQYKDFLKRNWLTELVLIVAISSLILNIVTAGELRLAKKQSDIQTEIISALVRGDLPVIQDSEGQTPLFKEIVGAIRALDSRLTKLEKPEEKAFEIK